MLPDADGERGRAQDGRHPGALFGGRLPERTSRRGAAIQNMGEEVAGVVASHDVIFTRASTAS